jgi:hypothetical protein
LSSLRRRLAELRALRGVRESVLFAYLALFAAAVPLMMRLPLPRLERLVTRSPGPVRPSAARVDRIAGLLPIAIRAFHPLVRPGCLTRGVTLFWFLRRAGLDVELRFGVDPLQLEDADGHCWLVLDGEPLLEQVDPRPRFAELYAFPSPVRAA